MRASLAIGINASGQVVGYTDTAGNTAQHAFITGANGVGMKDLGTLSGSFINSQANGINASGQVVGDSWSGSVQHAFITGANGVGMTDLNSYASLAGGAYFTLASGINDSGQIIAQASNSFAYLLTPSVAAIPEPGELGLMMSGFGLTMTLARRRQQRRIG